MNAIDLKTHLPPAPRAETLPRERFSVIVIGAGQAGLSVGYHLARRDVAKRDGDFVILDAQARVGDAWRQRWDSLRLFTPAQFDGLDGMPFPAPSGKFPTKDEMADYLEAYAWKFNLPVRTGVRVERLWREGARFCVRAGAQVYEAAQVVVAMGNYQTPALPAFAAALDPAIVQLDAKAYRNPAQVPEGDVLVAGAGNSGAEIAHELAKTHRVMLAGRSVGEVPFDTESFVGRHLGSRLTLRFVFHRLMTLATPMGRKMRDAHAPAPLIRTREGDLKAAGVERVTRVVGVEDGRPKLANGHVLDVASVVWCTGFEPGFSWIDAPVFDAHGQPQHHRGVTDVAGLYFVGLWFQYAASSTMVHGVGRDARYVAERVAARAKIRA